jgi:hypothetical protein
LWLIEPAVFQMPQLRKHFNVVRNLKMNRLISVLFLAPLTFLIACMGSKIAAEKRAIKFYYPNMTLLAWNEDTVNSFQFALTKDNRFFYTIIKHDSLQEINEYYNGRLNDRGDTLFLNYNKHLRPNDMTKYLVKEASGRYLIQYFTNGKKRVFLRRQQLGHRVY